MVDKVNVGVVGVGSWGKNHARVFSELESAQLVGVCDIDSNRVTEMAKTYGAAPHTQLEDLLENGGIEAVSICTPTTTHYDIALEVIKHGKHVLVEKPMVSSTEEARRLIEDSEKRGVNLMVGFIERFNPGVRRIKSLIKDDVLGEVILASARRVGRWPKRVGDVGVVKDTAIHDFDIMRYLFERDPHSVYARMANSHHELEDYAEVVLSFGGVQTGFVEANWLTPRRIRTLTITAEEGIASLDYLTQQIAIEDTDRMVKPSNKWKEPLAIELREFIRSIIECRDPQVTGHDGLRALEIAEMAIKSALKNQVVAFRGTSA
jgi:UDP-N-acetylglucosamine 3-dehydrogenase